MTNQDYSPTSLIETKTRKKRAKEKIKTITELVYELKIARIQGSFYFIGKDGYIYRRKFIPIDPERVLCKECGRKNKKKAIMEKLAFDYIPNINSFYPIVKEIGYIYYINREGNVCRFRWRGSTKYFEKVFGAKPTEEQATHLKTSAYIEPEPKSSGEEKPAALDCSTGLISWNSENFPEKISEIIYIILG